MAAQLQLDKNTRYQPITCILQCTEVASSPYIKIITQYVHLLWRYCLVWSLKGGFFMVGIYPLFQILINNSFFLRYYG